MLIISSGLPSQFGTKHLCGNKERFIIRKEESIGGRIRNLREIVFNNLAESRVTYIFANDPFEGLLLLLLDSFFQDISKR